MAIVFQIACSAFIIIAMVVFARRNSRERSGASAMQMALALYQILLCGWFFALSVSDILDIKVNFSYVRFILNCFYIVAFLSITVYTFFSKNKDGDAFFKGVLWAYIALIAVQCFVFPYGTENELLRVFEAVEGCVVFGLMIALLFKLEDAAFGQTSLMIITTLELIVAVGNVIVPFASITEDFQLADIPLNYASLFMRPVLFASLALSYRVRIDRTGAAKCSGER